MKKSILFVFLAILAFMFSDADAATVRQTMDGGMNVLITFPESVIAGRDFDISFLVENNGWEDKQEITLVVTSQESMIETKNNTLLIERLTRGSSYGATMRFASSSEMQDGTYFLNIFYSQVLLSNNETPTPTFVRNMAIPVEIKSVPQIHLNTVVPSAIFSNAEFPFIIEIISSDMSLKDVSVQIIPPADVSFRGQSTHTFSMIQKGTPIQIHSQIVTPQEDVIYEHKLPFEVIVSYVDDEGEERTTSKTVPVILRPRVFMELTADGGVWVGGFFLAPYMSIGTLVGIPLGTIFSLLIHRAKKKKRSKKHHTR